MFVLATLFVGVGGADLRAFDREPPRIAHFSSEYSRSGFVLDRSGELAKLRFDGTEEILILRWQPAAGGDRLLVRDDGEVVLRISGLGGVTLFTPENRKGIPVAPDGPAAPLTPVPPTIDFVRDIAGRIMAQLRAETGREIVFEANWNAAAGDEGARGILFDAIRNAGTALFGISRTAPGRAGLSSYLRRVRFVHARFPSIILQGDMLIVSYSVEQGLAGRPSSFAIRRQLAQIIR
ncbi:MAG: DUF4908 domain-containing protein [Alphaproteobacteria bacterium]|nr:DUF4908 domain-containing protein [Alphaproteobacteria bacterium]